MPGRFCAVVAVGATALIAAVSPAAGRSSRFFTVWLPYWNMAAALRSTVAHADQIAIASPFWYSVSASGQITDNPGAGASSVVEQLRRAGIAIVPTVTESAGLRPFDRMLASSAARSAIVQALAGLASTPGYAGLDLDFEQFALDPARSVDAARTAATGYPLLVSEICRALHALSRTCQVTVMARTTSAEAVPRGGLATWVYDYRALAAVADRVQIMAYDDHFPNGSPGPITPLPWVRQVIDFARSQMPAAKTELGLADYGYAWGPRGGASTFTAQQATQVAAAGRARPQWSPGVAEEYFSFGRGRHRTTAWYESARSDMLRAQLARAAGFAGVALWAAGYETPDLWSATAGL